MPKPILFLVGRDGGSHVAGSLRRAAAGLPWQVEFFDISAAEGANIWAKRFYWRFLGRRPVHLERFGTQVLERARVLRPQVLVATGHVPLGARALRKLNALGIITVNYSTDDPWNRTMSAAWYFDALREYRHIVSPRRSNLEDFAAHCRGSVSYLPFAYDPQLVPTAAPEPAVLRELHSEVLFVGGADADRVPIAQALVRAGLKVALYGAYWERHGLLRPHARGNRPPDEIARATMAADISLCLVRRANRDGHVMRSFEMAAVGACMLVEDTAEHRELFGGDGECVVYFDSVDALLHKARGLLQAPDERRRLAAAVKARMAAGGHTYRHRLESMLRLAAPADGGEQQ